MVTFKPVADTLSALPATGSTFTPIVGAVAVPATTIPRSAVAFTEATLASAVS